MTFLEKYTSTLQATALTLTLGGLVATAVVAVFIFFSTWKDLPESVANLETAISTLDSTVKGLAEARELKVVDILDGTIAVLTDEVIAGQDVWIAFHARANIDCERNIRVRFFSERTRSFYSESRVDRAVKAAVSRDFQLLVLPIRTFPAMPAGNYRYVAEVEPINCGVYSPQTLALSEAFTIVRPSETSEDE